MTFTGVVSSVVLMFGLPGDTWLRLAVWLVAGLLIYVCYGRRHGVDRKQKLGDDAIGSMYS